MTTEQNEAKAHNVEQDTVGFSGCWQRLTCHTCQETIVQQPHMPKKDWQLLKREFLATHGGKP